MGKICSSENSRLRFLCSVRAVRSDSPASVCASACTGTRCLRCCARCRCVSSCYCACLCTCGCHRSRRTTDSSRIGGHRDLKQCRHRLDDDRYRLPATGYRHRHRHRPDLQNAREIDTEHEDDLESGFIESTFGSFFGDSETQRLRKLREPNAPRYVKGLR